MAMLSAGLQAATEFENKKNSGAPLPKALAFISDNRALTPAA